MASRAPSSFINFFRQNARCTRPSPGNQIRKLNVESKNSDFISEEIKPNKCHENPCGANQKFSEIAKEVSRIARTNLRWEQTLISDYPSFDFGDPRFLCELLKCQNDAFLSRKFFHWLHLHHGFAPDQVFCRLLFDLLLDAEACNAANHFLELSGFSPELDTLERYFHCLCKNGLVQEALDVFEKLKGAGLCQSIEKWNLALFVCLKAGRTDLVWKLYHNMMESGVVANVNGETVEYLIEAFCADGKVMESYGLLRQVLEDGFDLRNGAFNKVISGFCKMGDYDRVRELLYTMISKHCPPDIYTYQEIINALCKGRKSSDALIVLNDLKDRGYTLDRAVYTTVIHGLCKEERIDDARKLWVEMVNEGIVPDGSTYCAMIRGFFKVGSFEDALKLHKDMCDAGYGETTSFNRMISWLCLHGRSNEALELFEEMPKRGIARDVISYSAMINGLCKERKMVEGKNLFNELLASGLQPSKHAYSSLIEMLCKVGKVGEAKKLLNAMLSRGLQPSTHSCDQLIVGLCEQGYVVQGMNWLFEMQKKKLKPKESTFNSVIFRLLENNRLGDLFLVLRFMFKSSYVPKKAMWDLLVFKLCPEDPLFVEKCLEEIIGRN